MIHSQQSYYKYISGLCIVTIITSDCNKGVLEKVSYHKKEHLKIIQKGKEEENTNYKTVEV